MTKKPIRLAASSRRLTARGGQCLAQRALHGATTPLQHVGVALRGAHVRMPQLVLHRANVRAPFQKVGGEGVAQSMAARRFHDARLCARMLKAGIRVALVLPVIILSGCHAEGTSYFLASGETEKFLTLSRCEREAQSKHQDGSPKYSGYECRYKFLVFVLEKKNYVSGKLSRNSQ